VATVLYPGSFDPIHNGHLEIIDTAASLFGRVVVAAVRNPQKSQALFSLEERRAMLEESVAHLDNVEVTMFSSLVVDLAREKGCDFIVRGLRVLSDFENEMQMAQMNLKVSGIHTLFLPSASGSSNLGSQLIRELARFGADVSAMVPQPVAKRIEEKYPS
jgi:pantetheine-phosphate adenylyltransferase